MLVIITTIILIAVIIVQILFSINLRNNLNEVNFKDTVLKYDSELTLWKTNQHFKIEDKNFNPNDINMTGHEAKTEGVIPIIKQEDENKFAIQFGMLVYVGSDETERKWTDEVGIKVSDFSSNY